MNKFIIYVTIIITSPQFNCSNSQSVDCGEGRGNALCENEYNIPECDYDYGDCCEQSCDSGYYYITHQCGVSAPFNFTDPLYKDITYNPTGQPTPQPTYQTIYTTMYVDKFLDDAELLSHTPISSSEFCFDHPYDFGFVSLGNWKLTTEETLTDGSEWEEYCEYAWNDTTKMPCDSSTYIGSDNFYALSFCCASNIWVIGAINADAPTIEMGSSLFWYGRFQFFAVGNSIEDIEEWYSWIPDGLDNEYHTFLVSMYDHDCHTTGFMISGVLLGILFIVLISVCIYYRPKSISVLLDSFEKYSSKIEF
eukprot:514395_1